MFRGGCLFFHFDKGIGPWLLRITRLPLCITVFASQHFSSCITLLPPGRYQKSRGRGSSTFRHPCQARGGTRCGTLRVRPALLPPKLSSMSCHHRRCGVTIFVSTSLSTRSNCGGSCMRCACARARYVLTLSFCVLCPCVRPCSVVWCPCGIGTRRVSFVTGVVGHRGACCPQLLRTGTTTLDSQDIASGIRRQPNLMIQTHPASNPSEK